MRVLATCTPGIGHINAVAPLLAAVQSAGHDVLVVTASESVDYVTTAGFDVRPGGLAVAERRKLFEPRLAEVMALPPRQRRGMYFSGFFADAAAPTMRRALEPIFAEFRPDVVIHDIAELADAASGAGVGLTCELDQRSTDDIVSMLGRLINEPSFSTAATRVAAEIAAMPSPADHVATIEAMVGAGRA